ncbi:MAG: hypothetical protein P4M09_22585 [Devosia sp.]|nr:hypothetical protein [Devosia sp.]
MSNDVRQCEVADPEASETAGGANGLTKRQRRLAERRRRRLETAERERIASVARAEKEEERAEKIAPAAQRKPVSSPDGTVVRGARLEPNGLTFKRSNPLCHLAARSRGMEVPLITRVHVDAAERLLAAWEDGMGSIGLGASNYEPRAGGAVQSGYISEAILGAIRHQVAARCHVEAAMAFLGGLWPVIYAVVIQGIDASSWATTARMNRQVALGFLTAALTRLTEFYAGPARAVVEIEQLHQRLDAIGGR